MKKILYIVTIIFFLIFGYAFIDYTSKNELARLLDGDSKYYVSVDSKTNENVLDTMIEIVNQHNVNVQKSVYRLQEDGSYIIDVYAQINNEDTFYNDILMKSGVKLTNASPSKAYLSSSNKQSVDRVGTFSILEKNTIINIKKLSDAGSENLNGIYYFSAVKDNATFSQIKSQIVENGVTLNDDQISIQNDSSFVSILTYVPLIFLLVILTTIYNYVSKYKEISVMLLNGYSFNTILKKTATTYFLTNTTIIIAITLLLSILHFAMYGILNWKLYFSGFILLFIIGIILTLVEGACGLFMKYIDISICLHNKKPQAQINFINIIAKVCFCFIIVYVGTSSAMKIDEFGKANYNMQDWRETINYSYTTMQAYNETYSKDTYEIGSKCQDLYARLEKEGAILMRPHAYYSSDSKFKKLINETQPNYTSERIDVNNNYLKKHPVYDVDGKEIQPVLEDGSITILIPEKYESQRSEIEKSYTEEFHELRYVDENIYNKSHGKEPITTKQTVHFQLIKNDQKFFSYIPDVNPESNNYITDPVIVITTSVNRGTDVYNSLILGGELLFNISNPERPYDEISPILKETNLDRNITTTPTVFSRVDQKQYELEKTLNEYFFISIMCAIGYVIITIFITLNYIESNKEINTIKKLFGFSFRKRNMKYYILNLLPIIILTPLFIIAFKMITFGILAFLFILFVDILTITLTLYFYDKLSINDVLKGS